MTTPSTIGTLKETALHAALKQWYARPGDVLETRVDGYIVDILRGESVIEIQTHNFGALKRKLARLLASRPVTLVHPIALDRWIVREGGRGRLKNGRRKSPRHGTALHVFLELVSIPELMVHPNFTLEVLLTREEEVRRPYKGPRRGRWRREWEVVDRRLLEVIERVVLAGPADCLAFVPRDLPQPFTSRQLAEALGQPAYLTQKLTYCLRRMGAASVVGKHGRAMAYACADGFNPGAPASPGESA